MTSRRIAIGGLLVLGLLFFAGLARAQQQPVDTFQHGVTSQNSSGTITVTNTFQSVFLAATNQPQQRRMSCTVQNNGSNSMYVFFGPIANATTSNSVVLAAGASVRCSVSGATLQDQVSITGTSGDTFYAAQQ